MKQPIGFTPEELEQLATQAMAHRDWLEELPPNQAKLNKTVIPPQLTAVMSTVLAFGVPIVLDSGMPGSACWIGGCGL